MTTDVTVLTVEDSETLLASLERHASREVMARRVERAREFLAEMRRPKCEPVRGKVYTP